MSPPPLHRRKVSTTIYMTHEQDEQLKEIHNRTKVPVAVFIREAIDLILEKYKSAPPLGASSGNGGNNGEI